MLLCRKVCCKVVCIHMYNHSTSTIFSGEQYVYKSMIQIYSCVEMIHIYSLLMYWDNTYIFVYWYSCIETMWFMIKFYSWWYIQTGPMDYSNRMHHEPAPHSSSLGMLPVHPDVKLKHLPFYDCVAELMKPTSLGNLACSFYGKIGRMY